VELLRRESLPTEIQGYIMKILKISFQREMVENDRTFFNNFEMLGGIELIEDMQLHCNEKIYNMISHIIVNYGYGSIVVIDDGDN
jgi:hypothetical protein